MLKGLPRNWQTEAPTELRTLEAFNNFVGSAINTCDPLFLDSAIVNLVMTLNFAGFSAKYSTLDLDGNVIMTAPGYNTVDEMFAYNNLLLGARGLPLYDQ